MHTRMQPGSQAAHVLTYIFEPFFKCEGTTIWNIALSLRKRNVSVRVWLRYGLQGQRRRVCRCKTRT